MVECHFSPGGVSHRKDEQRDLEEKRPSFIPYGSLSWNKTDVWRPVVFLTRTGAAQEGKLGKGANDKLSCIYIYIYIYGIKIGLRKVVDEAVSSRRFPEVLRVASKLVEDSRATHIEHFKP